MADFICFLKWNLKYPSAIHINSSCCPSSPRVARVTLPPCSSLELSRHKGLLTQPEAAAQQLAHMRWESTSECLTSCSSVLFASWNLWFWASMKHFWQYPSNTALPSVPHSLPRQGTAFWNLEAMGLAFPRGAAKSTRELMLISTTEGSPSRQDTHTGEINRLQIQIRPAFYIYMRWPSTNSAKLDNNNSIIETSLTLQISHFWKYCTGHSNITETLTAHPSFKSEISETTNVFL